MRSNSVFITSFVISAVFTSLSAGMRYKYWTKLYEFENVEDWSLKKVPSSLDAAIFPPNLRKSVSISADRMALCKIILPVNGQLLLKENGVVGLTSISVDAGNCPGQSLTYENDRGENFWMDPNNWRSNSTNEATPHVERLPCFDDIAVFPDVLSFVVVLPESEYKIKSLKIGGHIINNGNDLREMVLKSGSVWNNVLLISDGRGKFQNAFASSKGILDFAQSEENASTCESGCSCGTLKFLDHVCQFVQCPEPYCLDPIKPVGHCCDICGSYLVAHVKDGNEFRFEQFEALTKEMADEEGQILNLHLNVHVSKLNDFQVSIAFISHDSGIGTDVAKIANKVKEFVESKKRSFGIVNCTLLSSVEDYNPHTWYKPLVTLCVTFLVCVTLTWLLVMIQRHHIFAMVSESYARFDPADGVEIVLQRRNRNRRHPSSTFRYVHQNDNEMESLLGTQEEIDLRHLPCSRISESQK